MLTVVHLHSDDRAFEALHGIDFAVEEGEIAAFIGPNGAGKTTLLATICGLLRAGAGRVFFDGKDITHLPTWEIARRGIMLVPQGPRVFPRMSVLENLRLGAFAAAPELFDADLEFVLSLFPPLETRLPQWGGDLASSEQQMLALARALMGRPRLLLLDEPSQGLAPAMAQRVFGIIQAVNRERRVAVLLAEQNAFQAMRLANRVYVLANGRIAQRGTGLDLLADRHIQSEYLSGLFATNDERAETP
jgi:branched-chain amino acid transport system ATP-binding protein